MGFLNREIGVCPATPSSFYSFRVWKISVVNKGVRVEMEGKLFHVFVLDCLARLTEVKALKPNVVNLLCSLSQIFILVHNKDHV